MSLEAPKRLDPSVLARTAGDALFGIDPLSENLTLFKLQAAEQLYLAAALFVSLDANSRGIHFSDLPPDQQNVMIGGFLAYYSAALSGRRLETTSEKLPLALNLDVSKVFVSSNTLEVEI